MKVAKVKTRSVLFTSCPDSSWDLNMHLILGDKKNYLIDTGLGSEDVAIVKDYIKNDTKPLVVVNTHYHWDHIWGNKAADASLYVSHSMCRAISQEKWEYMLNRNSRYMRGQAEMRLADVVFDSQLYFPEDGIRLIYTPGHTIDCISILDEKDGLINMGDNIGDTMERILPDLDCDRECYRNSILKCRGLDFDTCISGHNRVLGRDVLDSILELLK